MPDLRAPPGRAGRLWLLHRLEAGRHAADLLDRKLRILLREQERLRRQAQDTDNAWQAAWRAADTWGLRTALLGGRRQLRLAASPPTEVNITWQTVMGLSYPAAATCRAAAAPADPAGSGTAATVEAAGAYREALEAAVTHAAAAAAYRVISAEVTATRRRRRALTQRWIPRLEEALRDLNQRLEEAERAEAIRMRWAHPAHG
ncbi:V-type ATP synthase subunit D [Phytohabitans kaempferiae]|uniref:V-type ATP synthase subunit D n=1 Tax=Phytohabitans kaempferiae TaxID=1620943 RepID=A0ABV6M7S1_9ACTN